MQQSCAVMCGSKAWNKPIRNCIAKTPSWGCSKVRTQDIGKPGEHPSRQTGGAMAVRQRGVDTSQLAAG
jgi:hypothetical protein